MPILLLVLLVLVIVALFWATTNLLGVLLTLLIAGLVGALADAIVPGRMPFGWLGAILAGLIGSWIGVALLGDLGPTIAGITIIPALIGAMILAVIASFIFHQTARTRS